MDVLIIGAGIGGIATAIWCHRLGLSHLLLERGDRLGGQLHWIYNQIPDYPAFWGTGKELIEHLERHLNELDIQPSLNVEVFSIDGQTGGIETSIGKINASTIVLATGMRRRGLDVPGIHSLMGKGVAFSASLQRENIRGNSICIVGGGDGAVENALMLASICPEINILCRSRILKARPHFIAQLKQHKNIKIHLETEISSILGGDRVQAVELHHATGLQFIKTDAVLIKIGLIANSEVLNGQSKMGEDGFVIVDSFQKTTQERIWAVGDVCTPLDPSISVAVGQACIAARAIERYLR